MIDKKAIVMPIFILLALLLILNCCSIINIPNNFIEFLLIMCGIVNISIFEFKTIYKTIKKIVICFDIICILLLGLFIILRIQSDIIHAIEFIVILFNVIYIFIEWIKFYEENNK